MANKPLIASALLLAAAAGALAYATLAVARRAAGLDDRLIAIERQLAVLGAEVTRFRIEQRADGKGPQALLEVLRVYAPYSSSARVTDPDRKMAEEQIEAVLRAFGALGQDALGPVLARFQQLDPEQHFDELKLLLRAASKCDPERGRHLTVDVLRGVVKPHPRLRWVAADLLLNLDPQLAQRVLREILLTESSRGPDPDLAVAYGLPMMDPAAVATTGFSNFVVHYLRSQDPATEDTLLQVLFRTGQDLPTLQLVIEELGKRKAVRAQQRIEELYRKPPVISDNPLFLNKCIDALVEIRGKDAVGWLETELAKATNPMVQKQITWHLSNLR